MAEDLLSVALRVRACFESMPTGEPDPQDVERLREAASGEATHWLPHDVAAFVIQREIKLLRQKRMSAA
jgi:hypothetical protein